MVVVVAVGGDGSDGVATIGRSASGGATGGDYGCGIPWQHHPLVAGTTGGATPSGTPPGSAIPPVAISPAAPPAFFGGAYLGSTTLRQCHSLVP